MIPTCSSHSLSSTCSCTKNRSFLPFLLVQLHCELWNRSQWILVSTPWSADQEHFLLSVHQQLTLVPSKSFRRYSKFYSVTRNVTLRISIVVFCWAPPLAHDCIRTLRRSIYAVRRHEVMFGQGAVVIFGSIRENWRMVRRHRGALFFPQASWHHVNLWALVGNDPLTRVELFLCQSLATFFVDHKLDALGPSRSSWRRSIPLRDTSMEAYFAGCKHSSCSSTDSWSNSRCFLVSCSCIRTSRNKNIFSCQVATNSTSTLSGMTCVSAPLKPTQAAQLGGPWAKVHTLKKKNLGVRLVCAAIKRKTEQALARKRKTIIVLCVSSPVAANFQRWGHFNCTHEKQMDCSVISLHFYVPTLQLILDVLPPQLIQPHVSGAPTGPTCQQGIGVLVAEHNTLLSCIPMATARSFGSAHFNCQGQVTFRGRSFFQRRPDSGKNMELYMVKAHACKCLTCLCCGGNVSGTKRKTMHRRSKKKEFFKIFTIIMRMPPVTPHVRIHSALPALGERLHKVVKVHV